MSLHRHEDSDLGHRTACHLSQAESLPDSLEHRRRQGSRTPSVLVLHGEEGAINSLLHGIGETVYAILLRSHRYAMVHTNAAPVIATGCVHPVVLGGAGDGQVVVLPDTLVDQPRLPRTVSVVLEQGQAHPAVLVHGYTNWVTVTPLGISACSGVVTV